MLNWIWLGLVLVAILWGGATGTLPAVNQALTESAKAAVTLVIGLVGLMVFWLGIMRVAFDGGLRDSIARWIAPLTRRLFPDVPPDSPAMSAMVMNMASNMLGLGNAATPFGLKAMVELARINPHPGSASNAMVLFLAINTSAITLLPPLGTVAVRAAAGSTDEWAIWVPTLIATTCSTLAAVAVFFALRGLPIFTHRAVEGGADEPTTPAAAEQVELPVAPAERPSPGAAHWLVIALVVGVAGYALVRDVAQLTAEGARLVEVLKLLANSWLVPLLLVVLLLYGFARRVRVYESAVAGAKEGLEVAVRIVPYLVVILVAVGMLRASGALDAIIAQIDPLTRAIGVPAEVLPMAILRPLSGSGAFGVMSEILETHGPDSFVGQLTCTLMGSTETTFYVLAVYLGAAGIREGRHVLVACLAGDLAGFLGAVVACHWWFG